MAEIRLEKRRVIEAAPSEVYAELAVPRNQVGLQPFLVDVREMDPGDESDTRVFDALESVPLWGPLRLRNRIRVRLHLIRRDEVLAFEARSFPGVVVRARFLLAAHPDGTEVREQLHVELPAPLRAIVAPRLDRAHSLLLANLGRRLEARRGRR